MQNANLLIVDDSKTQRMVYQTMFGNHYQLRLAENGLQALQFCHESQPDLIVMDIEMPEMDGLECCQQLRQQGYSGPLVFVSAKTDLSQRLRAYDVGGNDFIAKPANENELRCKIDILLRQHDERQRLQSDGQMAFATAMTAMTTMSEMGELIDFLRNSSLWKSYQDIASAAGQALNRYSLEGCMQAYGEQGQFLHSTQGPVSPLESSIIETALALPHISSEGSNTAFNYPNFCLVVRNMPIHDDDRCGRLRDHLAIVAEVAANCVRQQDGHWLELEKLRQRRPA